MPNLTRFTKSEELIGLQFLGTPESAQEITEWIKEIIGERYQRGIMQRMKTDYTLGWDRYERISNEAVLNISIEDQWTLSAPVGAYVVYDPTELEVIFRITSPDGLRQWKKEEIDADVQEV